MRIGKHETFLRVRYAETDQMGVVHHANYFVWMEIGRVELVRSRGINYKQLEESEGLFLSVIEASCRYVHPARYDDEIVVKTEVTNSNPRTVEFSYEICNAVQPRVLATGATRHMWLNRAMRPSKLPEQYRDLLGFAPTAVMQFPK
ncbi:MAG: thioesterase family protein [Bryobacteraceae bacterium]